MRKFLRITSKILFVLAFAFFAAFFIGEVISNGELKESGIPFELLIIAGSFLIMLFGFILSFKDQKFGGVIVLAGGVFNGAYMMFRGGIGDFDAAAVFGLPFIILGLIIAITEKKDRLRF
ncbi:MAG: hypothetical protein SCJ93_05300 [Bacillota bacterium]|nr:hypothetical protein [Bacillota bacterium]